MEHIENINEDNRLEELGGSDFEIVDNEPNIKGWTINNAVGEKIGEVDELLFNPKSRRVRYLVVDLDDNAIGIRDDRKVLVPIGLAELHGRKVDDQSQQIAQDGIESAEHTILDNGELADDSRADYNPREDGNVVVIPNVTGEQLEALPVYEKDGVTPRIESSIRSILDGSAVGLALSDITPEGFYTHEHFDEDRFYNDQSSKDTLPIIKEDLNVGKREVETGGARITSRLVEREVQKDVTLKEEHVTVERTPVDRPITDADQAFQETEIEMTEHAEIPVVSKEARVVEEISLNKETTERDETIRDTVRNTEIDTERIHGSENDKDDFSDERTM